MGDGGPDDGPMLPAHARDSIAVRLADVIRLDDLSPEWAWGGSTGAGVRVAIVDSGIEADHPSLEGCVEVDRGVVVSVEDGEAQVRNEAHDDAFGHGTACAGIIHDLAPDARITSVRVLGERLSGTAPAFLAGLAWAIDNGYDVVNLSLGSTKRDWALAFYELCDRAYFSNSLLVTAANNMMRQSYPSMFASVVSVACHTGRDPHRFHYNPDPPTEFLARGVDVDVAWKGGGRITSTGNSYAAPHMTGMAALVRAKHPGLRPFQVKTALWAAAANVLEATRPAGRLSTVLRAAPTSARATSALRAASQVG